MRARVVYDSVFGNTEQVARTIGDALGSQAEVATLAVSEVGPAQLTDLDLLVVGSPTRAFRPTGAVIRLLRDIARNGLAGTKVAAFDTRVSTADANSRVLTVMVKLFGYAAEPIAKQLAKKGGEPAVPLEGFFVEDTEGPLKEGELERATEWARQLAAVL